MPHRPGHIFDDGDPNAPGPRRPSNAVRRVRGANPPSRPQLPVNPASRVLSQEPRRSRNIVQRAVDSANRVIGDVRENVVEGVTTPSQFSRDVGAGARNVAQTAFPDLRPGSPGTPGTDEPDFFGEAPGGVPPRGRGVAETLEGITRPSEFAQNVGRGFQRLGSGEASGADFGRELGELGGGLLRRGAQSAVRGAGAIRRGASNVLSGVFEGLGLPTDLFEGAEGAVGRPGAEGPPPDFAAEDGLTPQQRLDLTFRRPGSTADITSEIGALPVSETARRIEERTGGGPGGDVERIGPDPTTVIRGTSVSQTRGGQDQGGDFPEAVFDEGFEVPLGTTDAELRDPERLKVLQARNSLSQSLRQVPAPGESGIPIALQAKMLADFDQQAAAESGATTRSRERNASLERRTAFSAAVTGRLGLSSGRLPGGGKRFTVIPVPRGDGASGSLGSEAFVLDNLTGATRRVEVNRSRAERDTEDNRRTIASDLRDVNPSITDAEIARIFRFWVDNNGEFPPGIDFNAGDSGGFLGLF